MPAKKHTERSKTQHKLHYERPSHYFSRYLEEPMIGALLVVIALLTLMFALIQFSQAMAF